MALLTADDIRYKKFSLTHFRHGYDMDEVDEFLEEIIQSIDELTRLAQGVAVNTGAFSAVGAANPPTLSNISNNPIVQSLRAENTGLQQKVNELLEQQTRGAGQFDNAQLLRDNQELVTRLKQAEEQIDNLTNQINDNSAKNPHDAVAQIQKLTGELAVLQRDYNAVVAQKQELDEEVEKLRQSSGSNAGDADALRIELEQVKQQLDESNSHVARLQVKLQAVQTSSETDPLSAISSAASASVGGASQVATMLNMAQQLHDEYVQKGKNEGAKLIEDARIESEKLISTAKSEHDRLILTAQEENRRIISEAKETADLTYETLTKERSNIEHKIDELRLFECDYRNRLKTFLENLLDDVDRREPNSSSSKKNTKDVLSSENDETSKDSTI